jgi:hypothetical protein
MTSSLSILFSKKVVVFTRFTSHVGRNTLKVFDETDNRGL